MLATGSRLRLWSFSASSSFASDAQARPVDIARSESDLESRCERESDMGIVRAHTSPDVLQSRRKALGDDAMATVSTDDETTPSTTPGDSPHGRQSVAELPGEPAACEANTSGNHSADLEAAAAGSLEASEPAKSSSSSLLDAVDAVVRRVRVNLHVEDVGNSVSSQPQKPEKASVLSDMVLRAPFQPTLSLGQVEDASPLFPELAQIGGDGPSRPCMLPGVCTRKVRMAEFEDDPSPVGARDSFSEDAPQMGGRRFQQSLKLATPSSCTSAVHKYALTPTTPDPTRSGFRFVEEDVDFVFFDFDGTLTATPGEAASQRWEKKNELIARASMLRPRLEGLIEAGMVLGIMSKSTEHTIRDSLNAAGLEDLFEGPIVGKAVGFEGKAGFIEDLVNAGKIALAGGIESVLLIDDDVRELDRARERKIQTFAAPADGGLQESDFDELFAQLSLPSPANSPTKAQ